jgi:hypothetical protein
MTTLAAHGMMMVSRTSRRPGNALLRNCARPSDSSTVMPTTPTTQTAVFASTRTRGPKSNRFA